MSSDKLALIKSKCKMEPVGFILNHALSVGLDDDSYNLNQQTEGHGSKPTSSIFHLDLVNYDYHSCDIFIKPKAVCHTPTFPL